MEKPTIYLFLERVIKLLLSTAGRRWAFKFKLHKHIGHSDINKVQLIIPKFVAAIKYPDVLTVIFGDGPIMVQSNLDTVSALKLTRYFL